MVKALDIRKRLAIAGFSSPTRTVYLSALSETQLAVGMHLVSTDEIVYSAGEAAIELLCLLPVPINVLGKTARRSPFIAGVIQTMYAWTADRRSQLARFVPNLPPPNRS